MAGLGCARCGDCCDPVVTGWPLADLFEREGLWLAGPDPDVEPDRYAEWLSRPNADGDVHTVEEWTESRAAVLANAAFIREHWQPLGAPDGGVHRYRCSAFDPDRRLCGAHDRRPPICSGFPWYGAAPSAGQAVRLGTHGRCSYLLDVAPADRPEGARPLIPIEVLR